LKELWTARNQCKKTVAVLGGAAVYRCEKKSVGNGGFAAEVARYDFFPNSSSR
jgi:hypothetical protein